MHAWIWLAGLLLCGANIPAVTLLQIHPSIAATQSVDLSVQSKTLTDSSVGSLEEELANIAGEGSDDEVYRDTQIESQSPAPSAPSSPRKNNNNQ